MTPQRDITIPVCDTCQLPYSVLTHFSVYNMLSAGCLPPSQLLCCCESVGILRHDSIVIVKTYHSSTILVASLCVSYHASHHNADVFICVVDCAFSRGCIAFIPIFLWTFRHCKQVFINGKTFKD